MIAGVADLDGDERDVGVVELGELHARFGEAARVDLPADLLALFDLIRVVRNRVTHYGGVRGSYLNQRWRSLPSSAQDGWTAVARREFPLGLSRGTTAWHRRAHRLAHGCYTVGSRDEQCDDDVDRARPLGKNGGGRPQGPRARSASANRPRAPATSWLCSHALPRHRAI